MDRRDFLSLGAGAALAPPVRPHVVIVLADDLGWADVGFHGSDVRTPHLDKLAGESLRLDRFYSYALCSPTRSALLTGRSPIRGGIVYDTIEPFEDRAVPLDEHLLPQTLQAAGYFTAMAGKWHLGHRRRAYLPNARGFDHSYGCLNGRIDYYTKDREGGYDWHRNLRTVREPGYATDLITDEACRLIRTRPAAKPLFLYVPYTAPHSPLQAPEEDIAAQSHIKDKKRRTFAAMVSRLDAGIGRMLTALEEADMARDTLFLFFSDNGGQPGQAGRNTPLRGTKHTTFEGGLRVPALLRLPGRIAPGASRQMVTVMDLFPTLCAAAGIAPRNSLPFDGEDMWPALRTGKVRPRDNVFFAGGASHTLHHALYSLSWKLVWETDRDTDKTTTFLFRPEEDPNEDRDLAAAHPTIVKDLSARLERWRALYPPNTPIRKKKEVPPGAKAPAQWAEAAQ